MATDRTLGPPMPIGGVVHEPRLQKAVIQGADSWWHIVPVVLPEPTHYHAPGEPCLTNCPPVGVGRYLYHITNPTDGYPCQQVETRFLP
jgi:hypothetical protein